MSVKTLNTKADFDAALAEAGDKLVVVDFFANWCGPCKAIKPKVHEFAKEFGDVLFYEVDVDENEETSESQGISAMPTFILYKYGKRIDEVVGANEAKLKAKIDSFK